MKKKLFAMIPLLLMCLFLFAKTDTRAAGKKLILEKTYTDKTYISQCLPVTITKPSHVTIEYSSSNVNWCYLTSWSFETNSGWCPYMPHASYSSNDDSRVANAKMECYVYGNKPYILNPQFGSSDPNISGTVTIRVYAEEIEGLTCGYDQIINVQRDLKKLKTLNVTDKATFFVGDDYSVHNNLDMYSLFLVTLKEDGILTMTSTREVARLAIIEDPEKNYIAHYSPEYASNLSAHLKKGTYLVISTVDQWNFDNNKANGKSNGPYTISMSFTPKQYVEKETTKKTTAASSKTTSKAAATKYTPAKPAKIRLKRKKNAFIISFGKVKKATGYQVQYSKNKKFKKAKGRTIKKNTAGFSKLKKGKYYVRVRSFRKVQKKAYYSKWVVRTVVVK